jgi:hypothetical protein
MKTCRYCEKTIGDQDEFCSNCGYDPKTDTISALFVKKEKRPGAGQRQRTVSPGVRLFAFWGTVLIVFSLAIKYQGKIMDFAWDTKDALLGKKIKKSAPISGKPGLNTMSRLIDVRSYQAPVDKTAGKSKKIEGIFYDPQGKSYVVIAGQLVSEAGSFGDMFIKKINRDSVEVIEGGNEKILKVNQ